MALATEPLGPLPAGMDPADLAAWTDGRQRALEPRRRLDQGLIPMDLWTWTSL